MAQAELRKVLAATGGRVVDGEVAVGRAPQRFDSEERLTDEALIEKLQEVVGALADEVRSREANRGLAPS